MKMRSGKKESYGIGARELPPSLGLRQSFRGAPERASATAAGAFDVVSGSKAAEDSRTPRRCRAGGNSIFLVSLKNA